ncbi:MAG: hypothetical protein GF309_11220 [Candidatus Lokiarchaeota archaeon]|nr:hypothetical protein [Candidatus Lokiarchaeota archaeon]
MESEEPSHLVFERYVISLVAIACAIVFIVIAAIGPLGLGIMEHRSSQSVIWQLMGQDLADLILITPILLIGGLAHLLRKEWAKYFLILPPVTLIYTGLTYGIGQEWNNPAYSGNIEHYFGLLIFLVIGGLILGMSSLSMFEPDDAPTFNPRNLKIYAAVMSVLLLLFAMMWLGEVFQVLNTGGTESGTYENTPNVFWVIRYFDLGLTIPLGFISLYLLLTRPRTAYPVILLFFGFFVTLGTAVNAMGWVMFLNGDPELQIPALVIFGILGALSYVGLLYLVKDKLRRITS